MYVEKFGIIVLPFCNAKVKYDHTYATFVHSFIEIRCLPMPYALCYILHTLYYVQHPQKNLHPPAFVNIIKTENDIKIISKSSIAAKFEITFCQRRDQI